MRRIDTNEYKMSLNNELALFIDLEMVGHGWVLLPGAGNNWIDWNISREAHSVSSQELSR